MLLFITVIVDVVVGVVGVVIAQWHGFHGSNFVIAIIMALLIDSTPMSSSLRSPAVGDD
jgi:hypothetical protein